jgi:hypothetical protein
MQRGTNQITNPTSPVSSKGGSEGRGTGTGQSGCVTLIEYANLQRREEQKILVILDVLCILLDLMVTFRLSWVSAI